MELETLFVTLTQTQQKSNGTILKQLNNSFQNNEIYVFGMDY